MAESSVRNTDIGKKGMVQTQLPYMGQSENVRTLIESNNTRERLQNHSQ